MDICRIKKTGSTVNHTGGNGGGPSETETVSALKLRMGCVEQAHKQCQDEDETADTDETQDHADARLCDIAQT